MASIMRFDEWEKPDGSKKVTFDQVERGAGLIPMIPSTVQFSGGTATSNTAGVIELSGVTSVSLNNVFGSQRNYRIVVAGTSTADAALLMRFRSGGTDLTSAVNQRQVLIVNGTALTAARGVNESNWEIGVLNVNHQTVLDLYGPNSNTIKRGVSLSGRGTGTIQLFSESLVCTDTNSYNSCTIYPASGTLSGQVAVYAYEE